MKLRSLCLKLAVVAALSSVAPHAYAQDGLAGALSRSTLAASANFGRSPFARTLAAADFDSDNKPDGAVLVDNGWLQRQWGLRTIEVHFTGRPNTDLTFESNDAAVSVSALDVNRDGATDIVVEQPFTHKRLHVWLNDGRGDFRKARSEDFPASDLGGGEGLDFPSQASSPPPACLPQRGSKADMLVPGGWELPAPVTAKLVGKSIRSAAARGLFSSEFLRGPPLPLFR